MLYIGDMFQLPPVVKDEEWQILRQYYKSPFFFHSNALQNVPPVYLELKKVYRQREQVFIELLNRVRNDKLTDKDLELLNTRYQPDFTPTDNQKYITLATRNAVADNINNKELSKIKLPEYKFEGTIKGEFPAYALPTEMVLILKEGAQIMFIKNDSGEERRYFNGKLGIIDAIDEENIAVRIDDGDIIDVEKEKWSNTRYVLNKDTGEVEEEELGTFVQYPIRLAWAITIHKSQGLTFERAIIDTGDAFAAGQSYVALSRCTSLEGIILMSKITQRSIKTDEFAVQLSEQEKQQSELEQILEIEKKKFWTERLILYFDCKELIAVSHNLKKMLEDKDANDYAPAYKLSDVLFKEAVEIQKVAEKFQTQLDKIINQPTTDIELLRERCSKAVTYFHQTIVEKMVLPLQEYINSFTTKKSKTFFKHLCGLEQDMRLIIENMKKARYNDFLLVDAIDLIFPDRKDLYNANNNSDKDKDTNTTSKKKQKTNISDNKQNTKDVSLDMFLEGKTIEEIATMRKISQTTVITHLSEAVFCGKLDVLQIVSFETFDALTPYVQEELSKENPKLKPIKEAVGDQFSYEEIRIVMNHWSKD
jgi:hypothetical protein